MYFTTPSNTISHLVLCVFARLSLSHQASLQAAYTYNIIYRKGAANGQTDALSRRADHGPLPLPSLPILPHTHAEPLLHTPYLVGAAVMVSVRMLDVIEIGKQTHKALDGKW